MICPLPYIDLPAELIEANSSSSEEDLLSRRRRDTSDTDDIVGWSIVGRLWNLIRAGSWHWSADTLPQRLNRQKRAPVAYISNRNVSMSLYLGFIVDKYPSLRNMTKTKPNLRLELVPFTFACDHTAVEYNTAVNPLIKIKVIYTVVMFDLNLTQISPTSRPPCNRFPPECSQILLRLTLVRLKFSLLVSKSNCLKY